MKNILLIGVGGTGSNAVDIMDQQIKEFGNQTDNHVTALVFDTDAGCVSTISSATTVSMADNSSVGTICDRIGTPYLREWFPCDETFGDYKSVRAQEMTRGASQWRKKSFVAFLNLMNKPSERAKFINALEKMVANPKASCEIYVIASIAGGTGSGSFIPIALYAKRYLRQHLGREPIVNAMIALPDIYANSQTNDNKIKVYSNAYAILRELNAINLVARNYNAEGKAENRAPVNFRIGHPDEPNVGVLFDASDERFWTPEAAPFNQIFILDRIPGLKSIAAHDIVLANSLYSLICTEIGAEFDSEASNHEILHSQSNGSNAIYAGISTSQLRFPVETVLDYLARNKALTACESEWMVLHRATERRIKEKIQTARDNNERYVMRDGEYAELLLETLNEMEQNGNGAPIVDMVDRGTAIYNSDTHRKENENTAEKFFQKIEEALEGRISKQEFSWQAVKKKGEVKSKKDRNTVLSNARAWQNVLKKYFEESVGCIKNSSTSIAEAILSFDETRAAASNSDMSLVESILKHDKKYIHPVAAMVQLCRLKKLLVENINKDEQEWPALRKRSVDEIPEWVFSLPKSAKDDNGAAGVAVSRDSARNKKAKGKNSADQSAPAHYSVKSSVYANSLPREERFNWFCNKAGDKYTKSRSDARVDEIFLEADVEQLLKQLTKKAQKQLKRAVYSRLSKNLDILIEKYRNFFSRFEKEKEGMEEETKTLIGKDAGTVDSVINIYCSEKDKKDIMKHVFGEAGPESEAQLVVTDDIAGHGVFDSAYRAAAAEQRDEECNEKDSAAYHSLFDGLIKAYRDYISKTDAFRKIASYNIVEAVEASCGGDRDKVKKELRNCFQNAQELSKPSLRVNMNGGDSDLVKPSNVSVVMLSRNTAKYIKKFADHFDVHLPADRTKESNVIQACAEEFVRKYSGEDSVRVSIVDSLPDNVIYCTGEIMDITPLRVEKFDECGPDNTYFKNYREALKRFRKFDTDMWNPHLGHNLHRRGCLPYMNPAMEQKCDEMMIKALVYALNNGDISYTTSGKPAFRYMANGKSTFIIGADGNAVQMKNVAQLVTWIRNQDELVDNWSDEYERALQAQLNALPNIVNDAGEIDILESAITRSKYMKMLQTTLFRESAGKNGGDFGPGLIELAYRVKTSEEASRDCDDAERMLAVAYETFMAFCSFRANKDTNPERFIQVYRQQLGKLFEGLAMSPMFRKGLQEGDARNPKEYYRQLVNWMNDAGYFLGIPMDGAIDEKCNVCINERFDFRNYPAVVQYLTGNKRGKVAPAADAADGSDASDDADDAE